MKRDLEEKRIEELFRDKRLKDERAAPSFARVLEAALSRTREANRSLKVSRLAFASAVLLILSCGALLLLLKEPARRQVASEPPKRQPVRPSVEEPRSVQIETSRKEEPKAAGRRLPSRPRHSRVLISQWRPPTDFLLKFPGEELLKTTPDLGRPLGNFEPVVHELEN